MRRLGELERDERGFTLIEVLIAATLLTVVLAVAGDGFITLLRSSSKSQVQTFSIQQNRAGMERLTRLMRQATFPPSGGNGGVLKTAQDNQVVFWSRLAGSETAGDANNTVYQYTVDLSGSDLRIGRSSCTPAGTPAVCTWPAPTMRTLVTNVRNGSSTSQCVTQAGGSLPKPVFSYFAKPGDDGTPAAIAAPNTATGPVVFVQTDLYTSESVGGDRKTCESLSANVELRNVSPQ